MQEPNNTPSSTKFNNTHQKQFILPKLEKNKSKQEDHPQQQNVRRILELPSIRPQFTKIKNQKRHVYSQEQQEQDTFAIEVQQKLQLLLNNEGKNKQQTEDEDDFEAKINKNKQIIKKFKLKKENQISQNLPKKSERSNNSQRKNKNQSLYQKKIKEISQNKIQEKKKEILNKLRERKQKNNSPKNKISSPTTKQIQEKKLKKRQSDSLLPRNQGLFDNIHNFLQNPKARRQSMMPCLSQRSSKAHLQQKLQLLDGQQVSFSPKVDRILELNDQHNNIDWRRVQLNSNKIGINSTNFDKQLERINFYQQKSQYSLERYVENQKILLEIKLQMRYKQKQKQ